MNAEIFVTSQLNRRKKGWKIAVTCLLSVLIMFSLLLVFSAFWYTRYYGETGFDSVMYTLLSKMNGVNSDIVKSYCLDSLLPSVLIGGVLIFLLFYLKVKLWGKSLVALILSGVMMYMAGTQVNLFGYLKKIVKTSTIYENYYVKPSNDVITFPEEKRNLIFIFLESMEATYMSEEEGGSFKENLMPELTRLAKNNINFSYTDGVGGFLTPSGTTWTVAGMVSQSSGVPLKGSAGALENNEYGKEEFLPGAITLSDVLHENGYKQALIVGSDASFANRDVYYETHKTDYIYDLDTAREEGFIPEDYYVWWGMEDKLMFDYAKDKIKELARGDEPFACTLLTVDTHFPEGYVCSECDDKFDQQYQNVIACASHQTDRFIRWIQQQDFYENTTVVICGDHLSMDYQFFDDNVPKSYSRKMYNCFINSAATTDNTKKRIATSLDIFPSTLAAMGCEIKGERLGLGTNLFSKVPTLAEEFGYEEFDHQLLYSSNFYIKNLLIK